MNPNFLQAQQAMQVTAIADVLGTLVSMALLVMAMIVAYACFLAIERFRELNNADQDQRAREAMLLIAERARLEREFELSQSVRRG